ncbi:uncharacterized protein LOC133928484 [Phragmites australis]|uniref:uncharacterized protein LOC133928484 n=1 Tax=Phragmites australis TaxID=29695 RepID=UPI002D77789D|nr:uncharacterized protein LOC133928484 [Phragmites australis]
MSLGSLGSLLTRRFLPRGIPSAQAESSSGIVSKAAAAAGRPARSLHTLRHLAVGDGALGTAAVAALAGLFGFLYFKKDTDESAGKVTGKKEVPEKKPISEGDMKRAAFKARFVDKDGHFAWREYLDYLSSLSYHEGRPLYNKEVSDKEAIEEVTDREAVKQDDMKDEAAMKVRFDDWMKEYGRTYKNEEEKARRYEVFEARAKYADKRNASKRSGARFGTNEYADWTEEEWNNLGRRGDFPWEEYLDHIDSMIAQGRVLYVKNGSIRRTSKSDCQ